jgi:hypothetical protein
MAYRSAKRCRKAICLHNRNFDNGRVSLMDVRRRRGSKRWLLLLSIVIIGAGALFGFEYLGSDQVPQRVEKSIAIPTI